jgi:flagellar biosynthetic protein FliO
LAEDMNIFSLNMITSLIIILGFILLLFFLLKRLRFSPLNNGKIPVMRVVGVLNIAPKRAVALVEIGAQWLIIGVGTENVTLISKLERPPEAGPPGFGMSSKEGKFHSILENIGLRRREPLNAGDRENAEARS